MSDFVHQKGYIYPLGRLTDEDDDAFYKKIEEEKNFNLNQDKFVLESLGKNDYLIWLTYSTYGEKSDEFGSCRSCNQQEIYFHAPKFREILGNIDTAKLKYIDFLITIGEFNTLLDIVKLQKFQIKLKKS